MWAGVNAMLFRVGDNLLSVNGQDVLGKTPREAEAILKALPRGEVTLVAMAPPRDVTGSGAKPPDKIDNAHHTEEEGVIQVKVLVFQRI